LPILWKSIILDNDAAPIAIFSIPDSSSMIVSLTAASSSKSSILKVEPSGLVRCVDARTLTTLWWSHTEALNPSVTPKGSPTLGVSRQDVAQVGFGRRDASVASRSNGNTNDVMLYTPVVDADGNVVETKTDFSLCRCGASKEKPFCDGSHRDAGFASE
ncbi:MAG: hypothetical protein RJA68_1044, partial [Actinomycetota bacterium]